MAEVRVLWRWVRRSMAHYRATISLLKAASLVVMGPCLVFANFLLYEKLSLTDISYGLAASFAFALLFVSPYVKELRVLTLYVEQLAKDKKAKPPLLGFLSNVEELSTRLVQLHEAWDLKRLELEASLIESKILFDILPDMLIMLDTDYRVVRTNTSATRFFKRNILGDIFSQLVADEALNQLIDEVNHERKSRTMECTLDSGIPYVFRVHIERFPIKSPAGIVIILAFHNITDEKRAEQMFADFVANASHEIRTPLTSVIGFIETLRSSAKDDPEAQDLFLGIMAEQAERMRILVSDLLSLSKIELAINTAPTQQVILATIAATVMRQSQWIAQKKQMQLIADLDNQLPVIIGDHNQLQQLVTNLVENAIKYGNENSYVTLRMKYCANVPIEAEHVYRLKEGVMIEVVDQGDGIAPEHIPRLTERFYRVDPVRTQKPDAGGTGLGLAIVKQIIKRHQGDLVIHSKVGEGSRFAVYLPLHING
jgi:two-component system phosphate regulon sensor histidine kinase PhoR